VRLQTSYVRCAQGHGQAVDPNLVRLAEAYEVAAAKLGAAPGGAAPEAAAAGAAPGEGNASAPQPAGADASQAATPLPPPSDDGPAPSGLAPAARGAEASGGRAPRAGKRARGGAPAAPESDRPGAAGPGGGAARAPAPLFEAALAFGGPRPGWVFGRGALGVGYYLDPRGARPAASQGRKLGAGRGAASGPPAAPAGDLVARLLALDDEPPPAAGPARLPGIYRKRTGRADAGAPAAPAAPAARAGRRGALPGRLRKKLAKDRGRPAA
jgi:hypothetical protein